MLLLKGTEGGMRFLFAKKSTFRACIFYIILQYVMVIYRNSVTAMDYFCVLSG